MDAVSFSEIIEVHTVPVIFPTKIEFDWVVGGEKIDLVSVFRLDFAFSLLLSVLDPIECCVYVMIFAITINKCMGHWDY